MFLFMLYSMEEQLWLHLGTCQKSKLLGPLLNEKTLQWTQQSLLILIHTKI